MDSPLKTLRLRPAAFFASFHIKLWITGGWRPSLCSANLLSINASPLLSFSPRRHTSTARHSRNTLPRGGSPSTANRPSPRSTSAGLRSTPSAAIFGRQRSVSASGGRRWTVRFEKIVSWQANHLLVAFVIQEHLGLALVAVETAQLPESETVHQQALTLTKILRQADGQ